MTTASADAREIHTVRAAAACGCTCASGARRTARRSCSSTAGRRTTSAGPGSTRARWPTSSGSSPSTCAATACPRRRSSPSTTPTARCGPTTSRRSSTQLRLDRPVLVGWSYGAFVICDYVRAHGQDRIAAIDFVDGVVKLGEAAFGTLIGPGFLDHFADADRRRPADEHPGDARLRPGLRRQAAAGRRVRDGAVLEHGRAGAVRANLAAREIDDDDVLRALEVPLLVTHGRADSVVLPAMAEHILATCPPPRRPGTTASATRRTSRSPSASTASWPS